MWQETKHGLYKQFNFRNFGEAFDFIKRVAALAESHNHYPRWENEWGVVQIWLITHESATNISDKDRALAAAIDELVAAAAPSPAIPAAPLHLYEAKVFTDGGSRGNPGPSASGYVILDMNDTVLLEKGVYLGITTNNQAEYTALRLALEECLHLGVREVHVYMDSLLVINQMKGIFKVKNRDLWPIHDAIKTLVKQFKQVSFDHVPREFNKLADAAVNKAMDDELGISHTTLAK